VELFLKFYTDKPCRVGIKYTYEFQAVKAYEDLVRLLGDSELDALVELSRGRIDLVLTSDFNGKQSRYNALEFKDADLQKLRKQKPGEKYEFVHIFAQHNTLLLAKPFRKAKFYTIRSIELRSAEFVNEDY
jgi:hypothetical protein